MVAGTWSVAKSARKRLFRHKKRKSSTNSISQKHQTQSAVPTDRSAMSSSRGGSGGGSGGGSAASVQSLPLQESAVEEKAGWLNKWTNYIKGYRQRWFVLDSTAVLSYYR
ncbi:unnamed protein product [Nippostrongylus brasiliensis]|uniref:PH domain-containing protein n=1 Tax=Nippostrongylus brasiliensis TaxID=27835 RepID=A0A0N4Y5R6_NIPBR|nr:unnamed protein product [Nippostrongylus brasiliensis]